MMLSKSLFVSFAWHAACLAFFSFSFRPYHTFDIIPITFWGQVVDAGDVVSRQNDTYVQFARSVSNRIFLLPKQEKDTTLVMRGNAGKPAFVSSVFAPANDARVVHESIEALQRQRATKAVPEPVDIPQPQWDTPRLKIQ